MAHRLAPVGLLAGAAALTLAACLASPTYAGPGSVDPPRARAADSVGFRTGFDTGAGGFRATEAGSTTSWSSTGGRPAGHMVSRGDGSARAGIASPSAWGGDRRGLLGGAVTFDERVVSASSAPTYLGVELRGGGTAVSTPEESEWVASSGWRGRSLPITVPGPWVSRAGGTPEPATRAQLLAVLQDLEGVSIGITTPSASRELHLDDVMLASRVARRVTLGFARGRFFGRVAPGCLRDQAVTVVRRRPGPDQVVGRTRTDRCGEFALRRAAGRATYQARISARFVTGAGGGRCRAATSDALRVSGGG